MSDTDTALQTVLVLLNQIDNKLDKIRDKQEDIGNRVTTLENTDANLVDNIVKLEVKIDSNEKRLDKIELSNAKKAGFVAAISGIVATLVTFLRDYFGTLLG